MHDNNFFLKKRENQERLTSEIEQRTETLESERDTGTQGEISKKINDKKATPVTEEEEPDPEAVVEDLEVDKCCEESTHDQSGDKRMKTDWKKKTLQEEQEQKRQKKVNSAYERWKQEVRSSRIQLKGQCSQDLLGNLLDEPQRQESLVSQAYDTIRKQSTPKQDMKRRMDSFTAVTHDIVSLMQHRISEIGEPWDDHVEHHRLHILLDQQYAHSAYGSTILNLSIAPMSEAGNSQKSNKSVVSTLAAKKAEAAAQLAAKEAEMKAIENEEAKKVQLERSIEAQRLEIRKLDAQKEIKVTQARMNAYNRELKNLTANESNQLPVIANPRTSSPTPIRASTVLNPNALPYCPTQQPTSLNAANIQPPAGQDYSTLAQALQSAMLIGKLPFPEPMMFNGDPLQYTEWKASFMTRIDNKAITAQEKFYYLKTYAGKEAGKSIQGFFLIHTEASYQTAWATPEELYGNPFFYKEHSGRNSTTGQSYPQRMQKVYVRTLTSYKAARNLWHKFQA